jgi:hypothetical protein
MAPLSFPGQFNLPVSQGLFRSARTGSIGDDIMIRRMFWTIRRIAARLCSFS